MKSFRRSYKSLAGCAFLLGDCSLSNVIDKLALLHHGVSSATLHTVMQQESSKGVAKATPCYDPIVWGHQVAIVAIGTNDPWAHVHTDGQEQIPSIDAEA